jgi:hypothetical protein
LGDVLSFAHAADRQALADPLVELLPLDRVHIPPKFGADHPWRYRVYPNRRQFNRQRAR